MIKLLIPAVLLLTSSSCESQPELTEVHKERLQEIKQNFVFVEGGDFIMGKDGLPKANPAHKVTLDSYSINKYEVTYNDYDIYTTVNSLDSIKSRSRNMADQGVGPNYGVAFITWYAARGYCQWLGEQLELPLDLPTEAQWEYAARSRGLDVEHATNNGKIEGSYTEKRNYRGSKIPVGSYPPNPLGLHDMSGGKPEWVRDWYTSYKDTLAINPVQDTIKWSKKKVVRGWHTLSLSVYGRIGTREPDFDRDIVGFRCVCNQKTPV